MTTASALFEQSEAILYKDGLGERVLVADPATGARLQVLRIDPSLQVVPSFEFVLRERLARLANFVHPNYARVRRVDRLPAPAQGLVIVSDYVAGTRLSELLRVAEQHRFDIDISTALCLIRELTRAAVPLCEIVRGITNGMIAPERLLVTPGGRLVILEHVVGGAIEQLRLSPERLWRDLRVPPATHSRSVRVDQSLDIRSVGLVALALLLGRPLKADDLPHRVLPLLDEARERSTLGYDRPLSGVLRDWLVRALQEDRARAFSTMAEASAAFERIVSNDSLYVAAPISLEMFLARCAPVLGTPSAPVGAAVEPPAAPAAAEATPRPASVEAALRASQKTDAPTSDNGVSRIPAGDAFDDGAATGPVAGDSDGLDPLDRELSVIATASDIAALFRDEPLPSGTVQPSVAPAWSASDDSLSFDSALSDAVPSSHPPQDQWTDRAFTTPRFRWRAVAAAAIVLFLGGGAFVTRALRTEVAAAEPSAGTLVVQTNPVGLPILIDGIDKGQTPARLVLPAGQYLLEVRGSGEVRKIPVDVSAGGEATQYLELSSAPGSPRPTPPATSTSARETASTSGLDAGPPSPGTVAPDRRSGRLAAPMRASRPSPRTTTAPPAPDWGWVAVQTTTPMNIRSGGRLIGTTAERVRMAPGRHEIQLADEALGFRTTRVVAVSPGKVSTLTVDPPQGTLHINAAPWAEVFLDGRAVGETPLGNLQVPAGRHELTFRHPQLGERHRTILVTLGAPVRVSVDMK